MSTNSVFVLGMHRSGASALAGALSHLGVQFVSRQDEMLGDPANPKGFFERPSILNFSDTLLETHAWAWHTVNLYPFDIDKAVGLLSQGRNLIANLSNDSSVGIKDPRSCLLMPFWRRALLDRFEAIVITRDPAEVAWSLGHVAAKCPTGTLQGFLQFHLDGCRPHRHADHGRAGLVAEAPGDGVGAVEVALHEAATMHIDKAGKRSIRVGADAAIAP